MNRVELVRTTLERYGAYGSLRLIFDLIHTRTLFRGARIVRRPAYVRGRKSMIIGTGFTTGPGVRLDAFAPAGTIVLRIGRDVQVNDSVHIAAVEHVSIGSDSLIASRVFITDHDHGQYSQAQGASSPSEPPSERAIVSAPVRIGERVWLGENVCVLSGVTIGDGAIIGASSVVTQDVPEDCVAVGAPASVVRRFDHSMQTWVSVDRSLK